MRIESRAEFPSILKPLFGPRRYKILYGGRGAGRSWGIARALLQLGAQRPLRILCAREVQRTIADSVHHLLSEQIELMGLGAAYSITQTGIDGRNGTEFRFAGLRDQDAQKIKSYEGFDIAWVEEAQAVTKRSWNMLVPTIRKEKSEIWVSFNPELSTDETYRRFVVDPPPDSVVIKMSWRDNPWFPAPLDAERQHMERTDPEEYRNIWEGEPRAAVSGAIYTRELAEMEQSGRICACPHNPILPVHCVWDLGWNDQMTVLMVQRTPTAVVGIDYEEFQFTRYDEVIQRLRDTRTYRWGEDWLPPDARQTTPHAGKSAEQIIKSMGRSVRVVDDAGVEDGIKLARMLFPRLYLDAKKCERLIECLRRYRRAVPATTGEPGSPVHDQYSHGADGVRYLAVSVDKMKNDNERRTKPHFRQHFHDSRVGY